MFKNTYIYILYCSYFKWYRDCLKNVTRDNCSENATLFVSFGIIKLLRPESITLCKMFPSYNERPPLPPSDTNDQYGSDQQHPDENDNDLDISVSNNPNNSSISEKFRDDSISNSTEYSSISDKVKDGSVSNNAENNSINDKSKDNSATRERTAVVLLMLSFCFLLLSKILLWMLENQG